MDNLEEKKVCKICYTVSSHKTKQVLTPATRATTDSRGARTCQICKQPWIEITLFKERGQQEWVYVKSRPKISLISEYQLCTSVEKKTKCPKAAKCTFAHSKLELAIWNKEREKDTRMPGPNSRTQLCKHISRGPCPLGGRCLFAHSYEELENWKTEISKQPNAMTYNIEQYMCEVCNTMCTGKRQLEEHRRGVRHQQATLYAQSGYNPEQIRYHPSPIIPRHQAAAVKLQQQQQQISASRHSSTAVHIRERPKLPFHVLEYRMCRHYQMGRPCLHGDLCTFAHSNEELLAWSNEATMTTRYRTDKIGDTTYQPITGANYIQMATTGSDGLPTKIITKVTAAGQEDSIIGDVRGRVRNLIGTTALESNQGGITVSEVSGTEVDLTLTDMKAVSWVFEAVVQVPATLRAIVLLDPLTTDFSIVSIKHTNSVGISKDVKGHKIKEGIGLMLDLKLAAMDKIKFKIQLKPRVGIMEQVMILDFDKCAISRSMSVRIVDQREARLLEYEEGKKANKPKKPDLFWEAHYNIQDLDMTYGEELDKNLKQYSLPEAVETLIERGEYDNKESEVTREDYKRRMHNLLFIEEYHQRKEMSKYDLYDVEVKCSKNISRSDGVFGAPNGYMYIELQMDEELFEGGRTVRIHDHVLLLPSGQQKAFTGTVETVASSEVVLLVPEKAVKGLNSSRNMCSFRFVVDRIRFRAMHYAVDNVLMDCVFPSKVKLQKSLTVEQEYVKDLELSCLNEKQRAAVTSILDASSCKIPSLVCGPFGCGKTRTLRECIVLMLLHNPSSRMLICTHSNSAADLYVEDIHKEWTSISRKVKLPLFRLFYSRRRCNTVSPTVRQYSSTQDGSFVIPDLMRLSQSKILVTTLVTARLLFLMGLPRGHFTHIFVDEAAQALECEALVPLNLAGKDTKIILAGDHMQIDPTVYSPLAKKYGLHISLLERLYHTSAYSDGAGKSCKTMLEENHRTHPTILELPSKMFYKNKLVPRAKFPSGGPRDMPPLLFVGAEGQETKDEDSPSYFNKYEASKVVDKVNQLVEQKIQPSDICVLAPYMKQVRIIRILLRKEHLSEVSVRTVDGVQGLEFRTLIISTVRTCSVLSDNEEDAGFLSNPKLFNTAITRAKQWLIIVGHPVTLCTVGSNRQCWLEIIKKCIQLESFEYTDPGKFEKYLDYKMMCRQTVEQKRHASLSMSPKIFMSQSTLDLPSSELFYDDEDEDTGDDSIFKELDNVEEPVTPSAVSPPTTVPTINTTTTVTSTPLAIEPTISTSAIAATTSYTAQPSLSQVPYQHPMSQQGISHSFNTSVQQQQQHAVNLPRQQFPMYQMSQPVRTQQYAGMSQQFPIQPAAKIPTAPQQQQFQLQQQLQQPPPLQPHQLMGLAQNPMLQMQNTSVPLNHFDANRHLPASAQFGGGNLTLLSEMNGVSGILNTEEESLTKLKSICTNQLSAVNLPRGLHDNLNRQKSLVDERLKLLQDQKLLFQQFCEVHKNQTQLYQSLQQSKPVPFHMTVPTYNSVPLVSNVSSPAIQPPSNATLYLPRASDTSRMTVNQSNYVTSNLTGGSSFMTGSAQNLSSASGSTPTLSGASDHDSIPIGGGGMNAPIGSGMSTRMLPPGSRPPGLAPPHMLDHNYMSQNNPANMMMYQQMSQLSQQFSQLSQAQLQPQPECHDLYLSDDEY